MSLAVLADHMASKGRGPDSMLIHMSPREVQGLQALAENHGGSLTINPETGLPEAGILDKLLPAIIGFALAPMTAGTSLAFLGATPMASALTVGGLQALRTGDIGKGIQAGLGAYGGAGLQAGLATAGTSAIGGEAAKAASGLTGDMAYNLADAGSSFSNALAGGETGILDSSALSNEAIKGIQQQAAAERIAAASPMDKLSAGFDAAKNNPSSLLTKDNFKYAAAAAAPILADQAVTSKLPVTATKPGMIRPYSFDPYGGTYTAGTPYEAMPTRAADGGLMGLAAGGMASYGDGDDVPRRVDSGGMFDFTQRSEPVVRMAEGGIAGYAGGDLIREAYEKGDYATTSRLLGEAGMGAQDVVSKYGLSQADAAAVAKNLGYAGDMSGIQYAAPPAAQAQTQTAVTTPTYTQYTEDQMGSFLSNPVNKDIDLGKAIKDTNADPAAVNRYIASLTSPFVGSTESDRGSGTFGIYNNMVNKSISPDEYYAAAIANNPAYKGWTKDMIQEGYNLNKGMYALSDAKKGVVTDTDWAKLMVGKGTWDNPQYDVNEMAQATGLSIAEVRARYELEKLKANPIIKTVNTVTNTGGGTGGTGTGGTGTGGTGGVSLETATKLPPGVSGAGVTTVNPNGTITTRPDFSLQMKDVRDTYEKGGGSLGVNKNLFVPKTQDELFARYKTTGGSKAALDYLMGKTTYSPTPYTPTGEIQKPYWESVGRFPENRAAKKYVFVNGKYELNPDYVKPSYVLAGEKAAALSNQDKEPVDNPGAGKKWVWNSVDKKWEAQAIGGDNAAAISENDRIQGGGGGDANGGLMAGGGLAALTMAGGGMSGQFDLGGYSDGGRLLRGPGDGVSDSIPATIGGKRPARLADGEFVVPARIVSELGNGSTEAGARKLYAMMDRVQKARRGTVGKGKVAKNSRSDKYLPA
jgi:hypothetical protein